MLEVTDLEVRYGSVTAVKGISLEARQGNPPPRVVETPSGMLNSIGLQNVGLDAFLAEKMPFLRASGATVVVNILGGSAAEYEALARRLDAAQGVAALEVNISCPNVRAGGISFGTREDLASELVRAVRGATGHSAQNRLLFAKNTGRWWFLTYVGRADSGTASSGSAAALNDTTKSWTPGQWLGYACIITAGTGAGQAFTIGNNTSSSLPVVDNGATGSWLHTALDATSQYEIIENRVRGYATSASDLATASWSEAGGSPSPTDGDGHSLGEGLNLAGGSNNPGGFGEFPCDGRLLAAAYGNVGGLDVVHLLMQQDSHYIHATERARITGPTTIAWDAKLATTGNLWNDTAPGIEDAPEFPQALSIVYHPGTGKWWWLNEENFTGISGYASGVADTGAANQDPAWVGNNGALKPTGFDSTLTSTGAPWNSAVVPLSSGFVLGVYTDGKETSSTPSAGNTHQTGLRFVESASSSQWPTASAAGAAVPNLSTASNSPNDWAICRVSDTDIHVVRRNGPTTLEHIRYSGHGGSWGSVVTLPTTGLAGHLAGSGLALVSDGTNTWLFAIDTNPVNSIRWIQWNGTSWANSWSTLAAVGAEPKTGVIAAINGDGSQVGVAWSTNSGAPYAVNYAALATTTASSQILAPQAAGLTLSTAAPAWSSSATLGPAPASAVLAVHGPRWKATGTTAYVWVYVDGTAELNGSGGDHEWVDGGAKPSSGTLWVDGKGV